MLPNFLIGGAPKCGTTSLYHAMSTHPEVFMSTPKEPGFFAYEGGVPDFQGPGDAFLHRNTISSLPAYEGLFDAGPHAVRGEATPIYLSHPNAAPAIRRHVPGARVLFVLRDPAERAHSQYWHFRTGGREPLPSLRAALDAEPARIAAGWDPYWNYLDTGRYAAHLRRFWSHVEREQTRVVLYEDLEQDAPAVLRGVCEWLGIDPEGCRMPAARYNTTGQPRSAAVHRWLTTDNPVRALARRVLPLPLRRLTLARIRESNLRRPQMAPATRRRIVDALRSDIETLQELLDRDLSAWLRA